jgi:hypothetical protein
MSESTFEARLERIEETLRWLLMKDVKDVNGKPIVTLREYNEQAELLDRALAQPSSDAPHAEEEPSDV